MIEFFKDNLPNLNFLEAKSLLLTSNKDFYLKNELPTTFMRYNFSIYFWNNTMTGLIILISFLILNIISYNFNRIVKN